MAVVVASLGVVAAVQAGASAASPRAERTGFKSACAAADLRLTLGPQISGATGEHGDLLVLTSHSRHTCALDGFPRITLLHGRQRLDFHVRHGGTGRQAGLGYVARLRPVRVIIGGRHKGYVLIAAYRCDLRGEERATSARLGLPRTHLEITVALSRTGGSEIDLCLHPETQPPNELDTTPIEPTRARAETPPSSSGGS